MRYNCNEYCGWCKKREKKEEEKEEEEENEGKEKDEEEKKEEECRDTRENCSAFSRFCIKSGRY